MSHPGACACLIWAPSLKSEVHVCQVKPHPECCGSPPAPWLTAVVPVSMCWGLDSSEALQGDSQNAVILPEATALSALWNSFVNDASPERSRCFQAQQCDGEGKGSLCPSLGRGRGEGVTKGQGRYVRLQKTLASQREQALLISVE